MEKTIKVSSGGEHNRVSFYATSYSSTHNEHEYDLSDDVIGTRSPL